MPDNFDAMKDMWTSADSKQREDYLFRSLVLLNEKISENQKTIITKIGELFKQCKCRQIECQKQFVTRRQAKIFGIFLVIFVAGVGIGTGYIAWIELLKQSIRFIH